MRILIVDNNLDPESWGAEDLRRFARVAEGASLQVRRGPHDDLPASLTEYDSLVLSGSRTSSMAEAPWVNRLDQLIRDALNHDKPILGVCYGHQSLARVLLGRDALRRSARPELGWVKIEQLAPCPLFEGLPKTFHTFASHFEEVSRLETGMHLVAKSEDCGIQAFQVGDRPVFGIQFHPERSLEEANHSIQERRKKGMAHLLLRADDGHRLYDQKVGETIFRNFFSHGLKK